MRFFERLTLAHCWGALESVIYLVQQFDDEGYFIRDDQFEIDRVTHGPDGTVLNNEDMPW